MNITISLHTDIKPDILNLILDGKLEGGFSIDYALNALTSFHEGKEVIVFDFNKFITLDNRKCGYKIKTTINTIEIKFE
jgi:hypothetical protein